MLFNSVTSTLFTIALTLFIIIYTYLKWTFQYWKRRGVPSLPAIFPVGHLGGVLTTRLNFGELWKKHYDYLRGIGAKFGGAYVFGLKVVVITDLELAKCVMQKDFRHFVNHGGYFDNENDPLSGHLFNLEDEQWKVLREKLTPTFTSGKMKMMFHTMEKCSEALVDLISSYAKNNKVIDIKEPLGRYSTDIIMSAAFGIEANCLKDPDSIYRKYGKLANSTDFLQMLKNMLQGFLPRSLLSKIKFKFTKAAVERFFMDLVKRTVDYREKNNVIRKDFMHLLIQLKNMGQLSDDEKISSGSFNEKGLTIGQLAAQAYVFFIAGFETSSTAMSFALYELALNPQVQQKLRDEINKIVNKHDGKVTYDAIMEMKYLDKVVQETLRKYPPLPILFRTCNEDYQIPDTDVVIKKGMSVMIPILGIQNDHEYFPIPHHFDPERFNEENKATRPSYTWLPFGEGPRICIGNRFGLMQTKVGIAKLIRNFEFTINRKTVVPVEFNKTEFLLVADGGIWLEAKQL